VPEEDEEDEEDEVDDVDDDDPLQPGNWLSNSAAARLAPIINSLDIFICLSPFRPVSRRLAHKKISRIISVADYSTSLRGWLRSNHDYGTVDKLY